LSSFIHTRLRGVVTRTAILAVVGLFAIPGAALASCPPPSVSTPFSQWGDTNSYFLVPGGAFEGTSNQVGWALYGASLTAGNEPFFVNDSSDTQSLTITGGGRATSPYFCFDNTMSSLRFFAQQATGGGDLRVKALVKTANGVTAVSVADLADGSMSSWAPTDPITSISGLSGDQTIMVAFKFTVPAGAASWQIDDVYVDPYRSG